jgi:hypothetical protein
MIENIEMFIRDISESRWNRIVTAVHEIAGLHEIVGKGVKGII